MDGRNERMNERMNLRMIERTKERMNEKIKGTARSLPDASPTEGKKMRGTKAFGPQSLFSFVLLALLLTPKPSDGQGIKISGTVVSTNDQSRVTATGNACRQGISSITKLFLTFPLRWFKQV